MEKSPVLKNMLNIGRYYALDGSLGSNVYIDGAKPHVILICGKRGYGKSYTMGTIIEELMMMDDDIRKHISVILIDTLGIFWTMHYPNRKEKSLVEKWNMKARGFKIRIFSSIENVEEYIKRGIDAKELTIKTSSLNQFHWAHLFNLSPNDYVLAIIGNAIRNLDEEYSIEDIIEEISENKQIDKRDKEVAKNFLYMASSWKIFGKNGIEIDEMARGGKISIIDASCYPDDVKRVLVSIIAQKIFEKNVAERKKREENIIDGKDISSTLVWLAIDEAHIFLPSHKCISKEVLINRWMRQGRQPGVSLLLATQRLASIDKEVLSHADIIISHRLTSYEDIEALNRIKPTYMRDGMGNFVKRIGREKGVAVMVDDDSEKFHIIKIRPRISWHAGGAPAANY